MNNIVDRIKKITYPDVVDYFGEDKFVKRYEFVYNFIVDYINKNDNKEKLLISTDILDHVIVDYFVDIYRLKPFAEIEYTNMNKIYAYLAYWLLKHKPIQIKEADNNKLAFINEEMVSVLLQSMLLSDDISIRQHDSEAIDELIKTMTYSFKYRQYTAQNIELILLSFKAGRAYQSSVDFQK